jgi:hypothetical protein
MNIVLPTAILLLAAAQLPAQTTIVVQGGGPALQTALLTAGPGDVLDVLPGAYSPATATRGVRIQLRTGAILDSPAPFTTPAITVSGIPATETLVLAGGEVHGIEVNGCAGGVHFDRV